MPDSLGELIHPRHCRVSVSADKTQIALTFQSAKQEPFTIVLPVAGAAGLQRKLAQSLYILSVKAPPLEDKPVAAPTLAAG